MVVDITLPVRSIYILENARSLNLLVVVYLCGAWYQKGELSRVSNSTRCKVLAHGPDGD